MSFIRMLARKTFASNTYLFGFLLVKPYQLGPPLQAIAERVKFVDLQNTAQLQPRAVERNRLVFTARMVLHGFWDRSGF